MPSLSQDQILGILKKLQKDFFDQQFTKSNYQVNTQGKILTYGLLKALEKNAKHISQIFVLGRVSLGSAEAGVTNVNPQQPSLVSIEGDIQSNRQPRWQGLMLQIADTEDWMVISISPLEMQINKVSAYDFSSFDSSSYYAEIKKQKEVLNKTLDKVFDNILNYYEIYDCVKKSETEILNKAKQKSIGVEHFNTELVKLLTELEGLANCATTITRVNDVQEYASSYSDNVYLLPNATAFFPYYTLQQSNQPYFSYGILPNWFSYEISLRTAKVIVKSKDSLEQAHSPTKLSEFRGTLLGGSPKVEQKQDNDEQNVSGLDGP